MRASVLPLSGFGSGDHPATAALKERATSRRREFETRRATILVLAWEAIATDDGGGNFELGTTNRNSRFARAKARARDADRKAVEDRIREIEQKRSVESKNRRAQIAREQEQRREFEAKTRSKGIPIDGQANDEYEFGD